ncbi:MAG: hypothetical protein FJW37_11280 [Acidobacteria bacterium]|nr:hypothetical protein [Acidobacteriota bacterium]
MKLTRRELGFALLPAAAPSQAPHALTPEEELAAARERLRRDAESLDSVELAMPTEPAFQFRP